MISNTNMDHFLLYTSIILASVTFFLCLYACARVGKVLGSVKDIGTIKKSIQTLNNRINGLNSPKLNDELLQYVEKQRSNVTNIKTTGIGG